MSRRLDDLCLVIQSRAFELIARSTEQGIPVIIVDTLRTPEEQRRNLEAGVSWTLHSMHLPQVTCQVCGGLSHAIDLAPYEQFKLHGPDKIQWDGTDPVWTKLGNTGESLGLRWGGRWSTPDMGHFEVPTRSPTGRA